MSVTPLCPKHTAFGVYLTVVGPYAPLVPGVAQQRTCRRPGMLVEGAPCNVNTPSNTNMLQTNDQKLLPSFFQGLKWGLAVPALATRTLLQPINVRGKVPRLLPKDVHEVEFAPRTSILTTIELCTTNRRTESASDSIGVTGTTVTAQRSTQHKA
jgi:hypothetical protein